MTASPPAACADRDPAARPRPAIALGRRPPSSAAPSPPPCGRPPPGCFSAATAVAYELLVGRVELAQSLERPQRVHRAAVDPDRVDRRVLDERHAAAGRRPSARARRAAAAPCSRQSMLSDASASTQPGRVRLRQRPLRRRRRVLVDDAVDAAALMVAQRRLVGVAGAVAEALAGVGLCWMMKLYQSENHTAPSGPDLRVHRREPLLGAGGEVPAVARHEAGALLLDDALADHVRRRLVDERDAVPVLLRERRAPCRGSGRRRRCSR